MRQDSRPAQRVIAFLDILGMRSHLSDAATEGLFVKKLHRIISAAIRRKVRIREKLPHVRTDAHSELYFSGWPADEPGCTITSISDSIVVSLPIETQLALRENSYVWSVYQCVDVVFSQGKPQQCSRIQP